MLLVRLGRLFVFAINLFRVWFDLRRLFLNYLCLSKCAKHGFSDITFLFRQIPLLVFRSSSIPISSVVVVSFVRFLSESLGRSFAIYCIGQTNSLSSLVDIGRFNCKIGTIFSLFRFIWSSVNSCPSQVVPLRRNSDFYRLFCVRHLGVALVF